MDDRYAERLAARIAGQMQQRNLHVCLPVPTKVVVELGADGLVKVYGPKHTQVAFIQRPVERTPQVEALVDEYVEVFLPTGFKGVYYPGNLLSQQQVEKLTIREIAERNATVEANVLLLKALDGVK